MLRVNRPLIRHLPQPQPRAMGPILILPYLRVRYTTYLSALILYVTFSWSYAFSPCGLEVERGDNQLPIHLVSIESTKIDPSTTSKHPLELVEGHGPFPRHHLAMQQVLDHVDRGLPP